MPRAGLTPASVVDAAAEIANADGLPALTLARLASRLGVRPPSLYKHVESLDAIHRALALRGLEEATAAIRTATVGKARDDALFALAHAYWRFARAAPGLYAASLRPAVPAERDLARAGEALIGTLSAVLAGYGVKGDDALHAARGLRIIIHGFVSLDAAGGFRLARDPQESLDRVLTAFARDLTTRGRITRAVPPEPGALAEQGPPTPTLSFRGARSANPEPREEQTTRNTTLSFRPERSVEPEPREG